MPGTETHYFSWYFERGPAWYGAFFAPAAAHQLVGEKSTSYLDHPEAAQRLREALPEVRLILQLRNPIERVWAHYRTEFRRGEISDDVDLHLRADRPEGERLRAGGLYFRHVSRFFELFSREQLCVTLYDDLDREPASVLNRVRAHVGLASVAAPPIEPVGNAGEVRAGRPDQAVGRWRPAPPDRLRARPIRALPRAERCDSRRAPLLLRGRRPGALAAA